jgi:hypothetical protein
MTTITTQTIIADRANRKAAGLAGCITGRPVPPMVLNGYSDVQSWRPADPMKPHCFCFDCRELWDADATVDLQLINNKNPDALYAYRNIVPAEWTAAEPARPRPSLALPMRSNGGGAYAPADPDAESPVAALPKRSNGGGISMMPDLGHELSPYTDDSAEPVPGPGRIVLPPRLDTTRPTYGSFDEVPSSLPAPRARDIMNESPAERLKMDLATLRGRIQSELVVVMDSRRRAVFFDNPEEGAAFLSKVREQETKLWKKLEAIDLLLQA